MEGTVLNSEVPDLRGEPRGQLIPTAIWKCKPPNASSAPGVLVGQLLFLNFPHRHSLLDPSTIYGPLLKIPRDRGRKAFRENFVEEHPHMGLTAVPHTAGEPCCRRGAGSHGSRTSSGSEARASCPQTGVGWGSLLGRPDVGFSPGRLLICIHSIGEHVRCSCGWGGGPIGTGPLLTGSAPTTHWEEQETN